MRVENNWPLLGLRCKSKWKPEHREYLMSHTHIPWLSSFTDFSIVLGHAVFAQSYLDMWQNTICVYVYRTSPSQLPLSKPVQFNHPPASSILVVSREFGITNNLTCVSKKNCRGLYQFLYAMFVGENW